MKRMLTFLFAVIFAGAMIAGCSGKAKDTTEGGKYTFDKLCAKVSAEAEASVKENAEKMTADADMPQEQKDAILKSAEFTPEMKAEIQKGCDDMKKQIMSQVQDEKKQKIAEGVYVKSMMESCKDKKGMEYTTCLKTSEPAALDAANKAMN